MDQYPHGHISSHESFHPWVQFNVFLFQLSLYYVDGGFWRETHCQRGPILVGPIPPGSDEMVS